MSAPTNDQVDYAAVHFDRARRMLMLFGQSPYNYGVSDIENELAKALAILKSEQSAIAA